MLKTERLILRPINKSDGPDIVRWRNQKEITDHLFSSPGLTLPQHNVWYKKYLKEKTRTEFMIIKKEDNKKIGTIGLNKIDRKNQKAEYGILIGEKDEQGQGYAKEATLAILNYGFKKLNLHKIYLEVFCDNMNAIRLYKKMGFIEEGLFRKDVVKNGEFKDVMRMAILKEEL